MAIGEGEPVRLGTFADPSRPTRRQVRVNGAEASAVALGEWLALSWLTPAMDGLFAGSAGERRRWLDRMAVALDAGHARHAARYDAALRERNRLLAGEQAPDPLWLDGLEAAHGRSRCRALSRAHGACRRVVGGSSPPFPPSRSRGPISRSSRAATPMKRPGAPRAAATAPPAARSKGPTATTWR